MKQLLSAFAGVLLVLTGLSTARAQTEIRIEPQFSDPAAVAVQVSFIMSSERGVSAAGVIRKVSPDGVPVWTLEAASAPSEATLPPTPERVSLTYSLGAVPTGTTGRLLWKLDGRVRAESTFTVPPAGIRAAAALSVNPSADGTTARVHVDFREHAVITAQAAPVREGHRFILRATAEPAAVIQIFPPPPFPSVDLDYSLGSVPPGEYAAVFQLNGVVLADKRFVIPRDPEPVPATVTATFTTGDAGTAAHVRITLPDPYFAMSDAGTPVKSGQRIEVKAALLPIATLVALPSPKIIKQDYRLGALEPGEYTFVYQINGTTRLSVPFRVRDPSPPDEEPLPIVACLVAGSNEQGRFVDLCLAWTRPGLVIRDWGTPVQEGNHFKTRLVIGKAEAAGHEGETPEASHGAEAEVVSPDGPVTEDMLRPLREIGGRIPRLERHRYPLGTLPAG